MKPILNHATSIIHVGYQLWTHNFIKIDWKEVYLKEIIKKIISLTRSKSMGPN